MARVPASIRKRALRLEQTKGHPLFLFSLTGDEILSIAEISRVARDDAGRLLGYQRPEVKQHVSDIVEYLNSAEPLFPNSLIFALSSSVSFTRSRGPQVDDGITVAGTLEIPVPREGEVKPAWVVDGQQRVLALSKSKRRDMPIPINAFVADEVDIQRDQFVRVNNTKPLPRGLLTELLPEVDSPLPSRLAAKKVPSALCDVLNTHEKSPFKGLIRRASQGAQQKKTAVVADTSVIKFLEESLTNFSGALFPHRNVTTGEVDSEAMLRILFVYWSAVRDVWPEAWALPPTKSRLMHGAGLRAVGRLMDKVMSGASATDRDIATHVKKDLKLLLPHTHWTTGHWGDELGGLAWNEIQNVPRHISGLSNFLIRTFLREKGVMA